MDPWSLVMINNAHLPEGLVSSLAKPIIGTIDLRVRLTFIFVYRMARTIIEFARTHEKSLCTC